MSAAIGLVSKEPARAAFRRVHLGQVSGRLPVQSLQSFRVESTAVAIVSLADARTRADDLWESAVQVGAQWSARRSHVAQLHTLCYELLVELAGRNVRTVAIATAPAGGAR